MIISRLNNNESDRESLYNYLLLVDSDFIPHLSQKTDLKIYSSKILSLGNVFVCRDEREICGLITFYNNDFINKKSYCSILSVLNYKRGNGIASNLLDVFVNDSILAGMQAATVHTNNQSALKLYLKKEFKIISIDKEVNPHRYFLRKNLEK